MINRATKTSNAVRSAATAVLLSIAATSQPAFGQLPSFDSLKALVSETPPVTTIVLVDVSGSINAQDRALYRDTMAAAAASLKAGDRFLVANIGEATRADFRPRLDLRVLTSDVRLEKEAGVRAARQLVQSKIDTLVPAGGAKDRATRIMETIAAAATALPTKGRHRVVILSDAVEESATINLARAPASDAAIATAIAKAKADGLTPSMRNVSLYFVGAGGRHYAATQKFWQAYARATGATIRQYSRLTLQVEGK